MSITNINQVLKEQLLKIKPSYEEISEIDNKTKILVADIKSKLKKKKIKADVFVGGSVAKNTLIKKQKYDVDLFVRFDTKYKEKELSKLLKKVLPSSAKVLHGSRDYFVLQGDGLEFEIIPTVKVSKQEEARNITDLSYFHVNYVGKHINKNSKLADEIRLAKGFAYYQDCYGAESYINGFSGYALELLIIHYKSFMNFIKAMAKQDPKKKIIIDIAKKYKNTKVIKEELNEAKTKSPIIFIDPTYKERNALAALSEATYKRFQASCKQFIKKPSARFFELEDKQKVLEKKYKKDLVKLEIKTDRQAGDIAGTKLKKFSRYFIRELEKNSDVKASDFDYDEKTNIGIIYLVSNSKKELLICGPPVKLGSAVKAFRKEHKNKTIKTKAGRLCFTIKSKSFNDFYNSFIKDKKILIKEMSVKSIKII